MRNTLKFCPFRKYKEEVEAFILADYDNGKLENKYEFWGLDILDYSWSRNRYIYVGDIVNNTLEGNGSLYNFHGVIDEIEYNLLYEGVFRGGRFVGEGVIFWGDDRSEVVEAKILPNDRIIKIRNPFLVFVSLKPIVFPLNTISCYFT